MKSGLLIKTTFISSIENKHFRGNALKNRKEEMSRSVGKSLVEHLAKEGGLGRFVQIRMTEHDEIMPPEESMKEFHEVGVRRIEIRVEIKGDE
jgi:hypothetical protein